MNTALIHIALIVLLLIGFLFSVRAIGRRYLWHSEWQRKVLHIGLGLTALSFPWIFREIWQVALLCSIALSILLLIRFVPRLRNGVGRSLYEVNRSSLGELLFALSIIILFWLSRGDIVLYVIPLSTLTISDALASIVGIYYGRKRYEVVGGIKSWEGTIAFFSITFLILVLLLYVLSDLSWPVVLIIAAIFAVLIALVEAVCWHGFDNLLIPLASFLLLDVFMQESISQLTYHFSVLAGLIGIGLTGGPICKINTHALMAATISLYFFWIVRDILWVVPPIIIFFVHLAIIRLMKIEEEEKFTIDAVMSVMSGGFFWLLMEELFGISLGFLLFTLSLTIHLHAIILLRLRDFKQKEVGAMTTLLIGLLSGVLVFFPFIMVYYGFEYQRVLFFCGLGTLVTLVVGLVMRVLDRLSRRRWVVEGVLALVGSATALLPLWMMKW